MWFHIGIPFYGELHNVKLVQFKVDPAELAPQLPAHIQPRLFNGQALISMVNVELKNMLDRAFTFHHRALLELIVTRKAWPVQPIQLEHFSTNIFNSATPVGALKVPEVIRYRWSKPNYYHA